MQDVGQDSGDPIPSPQRCIGGVGEVQMWEALLPVDSVASQT